jgi:hypothetical protein
VKDGERPQENAVSKMANRAAPGTGNLDKSAGTGGSNNAEPRPGPLHPRWKRSRVSKRKSPM